eukprot:5416000-Karenia_brevis.AAC.1
MLGHTIRSKASDPISQCILKYPSVDENPEMDMQAMNIPDKFRVGRPTTNWIRDTMQHVWNKWSWCGRYGHSNFKYRDPQHV